MMLKRLWMKARIGSRWVYVGPWVSLEDFLAWAGDRGAPQYAYQWQSEHKPMGWEPTLLFTLPDTNSN